MGIGDLFNTGNTGAYAKRRSLAEDETSERNAKAQATFYDETGSDETKKALEGRMAALAAMKAPQVTGPTFGSDAYMSAAKVGPVSKFAGAKVDRGDEMASRSAQLAAMSRAQLAATGGGPSTAGLQMGASVDHALASRAAMLGAAPRTGGALAALGAGKAASGIMGQGIATSSATKSAEAAQGAQAFAGLSSGIRAGDISGSYKDAGLEQDAALFSAQASNAATLANAGFAQQAGLFNASQAQQEAELRQKAELANVEATLRSRGMTDAAIASYLAAYQKQFQTDKAAKMGSWEFAQGNNQFTTALQDKKNADSAAADSARLSGFASLLTLGASAAGGGGKK